MIHLLRLVLLIGIGCCTFAATNQNPEGRAVMGAMAVLLAVALAASCVKDKPHA